MGRRYVYGTVGEVTKWLKYWKADIFSSLESMEGIGCVKCGKKLITPPLQARSQVEGEEWLCKCDIVECVFGGTLRSGTVERHLCIIA